MVLYLSVSTSFYCVPLLHYNSEGSIVLSAPLHLCDNGSYWVQIIFHAKHMQIVQCKNLRRIKSFYSAIRFYFLVKSEKNI